MKLFVLFLGVLLSFTVGATSKIPQDVMKALSVLPEKSLTLDLVLLGGLKSDSFGLIKVQALQREVLKFSRKAPFDISLIGSLVKGDDQSAPNRPGSAFSAKSLVAGIGVNKYFSTGTAISLTSNYQDIDSQATSFFEQGQGVESKYHENKVSLDIRQNLWRDSFGYATRRSLQALEIQEKNVINEVAVNSEKWAYDLLRLYYNAWLSQEKVRVARDNHKRQKRLLRVTKLKLKRGTAEQPDLLQVMSAEKNTKQSFKEANQDLADIWRHLVVTLKFPQNWMTVDPLLIPMKLDQPISQASSVCSRPLNLDVNTELTSLREQLKATESNLNAAKNQLWPEAYLGVRLTSNGVDSSDRDRALSESFKNQNKGVFVELGLSIPIGNYEKKSSLVRAAIQEQMAKTRLAAMKGSVETNWKNQCLNLSRLIMKRKDLRSVYKMQKQRAKLEEKRFRIGRLPAFNAIQAANDAALAQLSLKQVEVNVRVSAWSILKMQGYLKDHLKKMVGEKK